MGCASRAGPGATSFYLLLQSRTVQWLVPGQLLGPQYRVSSLFPALQPYIYSTHPHIEPQESCL